MAVLIRFAVLTVCLCVFPAAPSSAAAAAPAFSPDDVFALEWAEQPQLSPDGKQVVYQRRGFDRMKDRKSSSLWQIDVASGEQRPLGGEGNQSGAAWSPDGKRLAYVGGGEGGAQIHVRWMDDGVTARITQLERGAGSLTWSPMPRVKRV